MKTSKTGLVKGLGAYLGPRRGTCGEGTWIARKGAEKKIPPNIDAFSALQRPLNLGRSLRSGACPGDDYKLLSLRVGQQLPGSLSALGWEHEGQRMGCSCATAKWTLPSRSGQGSLL